MKVCNYKLRGKVTGSVPEEEFEIDTISYPLSNYFIKNIMPKFFMKMGVEQTFLFNSKGEIVDTLEESAVYDGEYVFLLDARYSSEEEVGTIKYVTMNGAMLTCFLAEKVRLNGAPRVDVKNIVEKPLLPVIDGIKQRQVIYIEKNSEGKVSAIYTKDQEGLDGTKYENKILSAGPVEKSRKCKESRIFLQDTNDMNFPEFYIDSETKILMVPESSAEDEDFKAPENYQAKSLGYFVDANDYTVEAYNLDEYNVADIMILRQAQSFDTQHSNDSMVLVTGFGKALDDDNQVLDTVCGYQNGERVELKVQKTDALYYMQGNEKKKIANGDIVRFNLNNKGYITHNQYFKNVESNFDITTYPEGRNDGNAIAIGYVVSKNDNYLKLDFTDEATIRERVFSGKVNNITIYDSATGKCEKGVWNDLAPGSKVMIRVFYSSLQDVILYR